MAPATCTTSPSGVRQSPLALCFGSLAKLHLSIVVSLEVARLLIEPLDAELAEALRAYSLRAWELFRLTGHYTQRSVSTARGLSQNPSAVTEAHNLVNELQGETLEQLYAALGDDVDEVLHQVYRKKLRLATPSSELDLTALQEARGATARDVWASRRFDAVLQLHAGSQADLVCFLISGHEQATSPKDFCEQIAREVPEPVLFQELENAMLALGECRDFWTELRRQVFRLSLSKQHLSRLGQFASSSAALRGAHERRFQEYCADWCSFSEFCT